MKISPDTKISEVLKENKEAIEVIASVNKHFRKLKNPFLRKTLGSRVSIKEAASIGGVLPEEIISKLSEIGFEVEDIISKDKSSDEDDSKDENFSIPKDKVSITLDVRRRIEKGKDPIKRIISSSQRLDLDEYMLVINKFEPLPIIHLLAERGFSSKVEKLAEDEIHTYFWKKEEKKDCTDNEPKTIRMVNLNDFEARINEFESIKKIDVRHLEMPEPMVRILEEIELITEDSALYVDHKQVPQYLLPQLEKRSFEAMAHEIDSNYIKLLIYIKK